MSNPKLSQPVIYILIILITICSFPVAGFTQNEQSDQVKKSLAIIPFEVISQDDIKYIQSGVSRMLYSRLEWKNRVTLVEKNSVLKHIETINTENPNQMIKKIADLTNCDYVLTGSIIHFSNAFSIDTKIYDIKKRQYITFFEQSRIIDDIIPKLNAVTARINKKVFDRKTIAWDNLKNQEKEKALQWQRQNPENLMPVIPKGEQKEKSSIWKIWEYL
ncbi:hypothetical protein QUF70_15405 [Desulfobacterales bacterium HSG17]|nr:hypothetical protein [Desulfobacterales bacterium HSG17]